MKTGMVKPRQSAPTGQQAPNPGQRPGSHAKGICVMKGRKPLFAIEFQDQVMVNQRIVRNLRPFHPVFRKAHHLKHIDRLTKIAFCIHETQGDTVVIDGVPE